nr:hypothetical protein [Tanacetum cinerariifolium]
MCIRHITGPNAKQIENDTKAQFKGQYKNSKNKFKDDMFVSRGGVKLPQCSTQGSKSYAASRHEEWETNVVFPNLIEHYKNTHQKKGKWVKEVFETKYNKMLKLGASQKGLAEKMTDDGIMDKVLGSIRAFKLGQGKKLPNSASSSSVCSYPAPPQLASQAALRKFVEAHNEQMKDWHSQLADKNIEL